MSAQKQMKIGGNQYLIQEYVEKLKNFKFIAKVENTFDSTKYLISNEEDEKQRSSLVFG